MSKLTTLLPIQPFTKFEKTHTHVRIDVQYDKNAKGPRLYLQTIQFTPPTPGGFSGESFILFHSPSTNALLERGWRCNNKKKLEAAFETAMSQIRARSGHCWDVLSYLLTDVGSTLLTTRS